jgi:hypothetical protein
MRHYFGIVMASVIISILLGFFVFNFSFGITGSAISDSGESVKEKVTENKASSEILRGEELITEMTERELPTQKVNDLMIDARRIFDIAKNAEILRDVNATREDKFKAGRALKLIDWKDIDFEDVVLKIEEIERNLDLAKSVGDSLRAMEIEITDYYKREDASVLQSPEDTPSLVTLEEAKKAYKDARFVEAERLIQKVSEEYENELAGRSTLSTVNKGARNFVQRYWIFILIFVAVLGFFGNMSIEKFRKQRLEKKVKKMHTEKEAIFKIMRKTQELRFKENKISGLVYNVRMKAYRERLNKIKSELPVLEKELLRYRKIEKKELKSSKKIDVRGDDGN